MASMRLPGQEPIMMMECTAVRESSLPVDEIYGAMAVSGVQITPLKNETIDQAWLRWCEAAVARGHLRWLMLPPIANAVLFDATQGSCLFPSASTLLAASNDGHFHPVVPYGPPSISAGTVTLAAKYAGNCTILRRLGPLHSIGTELYPMNSLVLFSKGDWSLAAHIVESFSSRAFSRTQLHAIAKVLANSYEPLLRSLGENETRSDPAQFFPVISSSFEQEAFCAFKEFVDTMVIGRFKGSIAYLALLESEELNFSIPVSLALGDRVPTRPLVAFDVNTKVFEDRWVLLIAEKTTEDVERELHDPDFSLEDIIHHKVGVTGPVKARFETPVESISIGGSRCPVCQTIDRAT